MKIAEHTRRNILRFHEDGMDTGEIAIWCGVKESTVISVIKKYIEQTLEELELSEDE